jgi:hypothetical protein
MARDEKNKVRGNNSCPGVGTKLDDCELPLRQKFGNGGFQVTLGTILIIILILILIGALPSWGYSRDWGYFPSGGIGLVLIVIFILVLMGRI